MLESVTNALAEVAPHFEGYVYPNEATHQPLWSISDRSLPVHHRVGAGAFIMASLVRVFNVKAWNRSIGLRC